MEDDRYQRLWRWLRLAPSRRHAVGRGLAALGFLSVEGSGLSKRRRKRNKKKRRRTASPPSCRELCGEDCVFCFYRADAPPLCGENIGFQCDAPCTTDNDCAGSSMPYCGTSYEYRESAQVVTACPAAGGFCGNIVAPCQP